MTFRLYQEVLSFKDKYLTKLLQEGEVLQVCQEH